MSDEEELDGQLIGDRYRIERTLGRGGMGRVFAAVDTRGDESVAIKLLHAKFTSTKRIVERLRREARILHDLNHPGIVQLLDCGPLPNGSVFVAMEQLSGETLHARLRRDGSVPWQEVARILIALCDAVGTAHARSIVHRDIKPSNIFLTDDEEHPAKLIDFGIAVAADLKRLTLTGEVIGSPAWMAPEQLLESKSVDNRVDIYGLGLVGWAATAGRIPFTGTRGEIVERILEGRFPHLSDELPGVPEQFGDVIARACALEADDRHSDAIELAIALGRCIDIELEHLEPRPRRWTLRDPDTNPDASSQKPPAPARGMRGRVLRFVAGVAIGASAAGLGFGVLSAVDDPPPAQQASSITVSSSDASAVVEPDASIAPDASLPTEGPADAAADARPPTTVRQHRSRPVVRPRPEPGSTDLSIPEIFR